MIILVGFFFSVKVTSVEYYRVKYFIKCLLHFKEEKRTLVLERSPVPCHSAQFVGESDLYLRQLGLGQSFDFTELTF